jgi:glycosyltransferase involved in cell wall biosynthesis
MATIEQLAGRRILFLNWRDQSNPQAGGAESYTEEIAQRFVHAGSLVTLFTSKYRGAAPYETSNGYSVIRQGGRFGIYLAAARYLRRHANDFDAVVDFQNGIPFFAPLWAPAKMPVICVVHHVHQRQFDMYFRWPMNQVGRLLEGRASRRVYKKVPFIAVSPSTRAEMRTELRFRNPIYIVPNGMDLPQPSSVPRSPQPTIAVVTRLVPHKQLHHLVEAVPDLLAQWPDLRVTIAGSGPASEALQVQVRQLALENVVTLPGRVSAEAKRQLLAEAWLTVAPSMAEGWGLTVMEAGAVGTPAVAYDVPGLRDSVRHGITGWLVQPGESLATALNGAISELSDPQRQCALEEQAIRWAANFSWDTSADRLASVLVTEMKRKELRIAERRQAIDLATIASWPPDASTDRERMLQKTLRATDIITIDESGISALLIGCDEVGALKALKRGAIPVPTLRLATSRGLLSGNPGKDPEGDAVGILR